MYLPQWSVLDQGATESADCSVAKYENEAGAPQHEKTLQKRFDTDNDKCEPFWKDLYSKNKAMLCQATVRHHPKSSW